MKTDERNKFAIKSFLGEYLDLKKDKDNELATVDSIRKGVEFKGANLWILIFAIFMASLGLNVNSTAVIIGAMLISPLMGPIMGVGLSVGLNDFELMKRSLKSFLITTAFSVTTATIFFFLAPIAGSQSELLARTSPTIYDVFIALFGGLAGVVALSTKEKGNVIPGVAIATALMPPLCTAGYGLVSGNLIYFLGAFYNSKCQINRRAHGKHHNQNDVFTYDLLTGFIYKLCFYQSGYFPRSSCDAFPTKRVCR